MNNFQMKAIEGFLREHPCPSWADEKQWTKLLDKAIFSPEGGISYANYSIIELKILEGYSFESILSQRVIHKDERSLLLERQAFRSGKPEGEVMEILRKLWADCPDAEPSEIIDKFSQSNPELFNLSKFRTLQNKVTLAKKPKKS